MGAKWLGAARATVQRRRGAGFAVGLRGPVAALVVVVAFVTFVPEPAGASAEPLCTDSWSGPSEGSWSTAGDWSAGKVPTSSDVACLGPGTKVKVSSGENHAGVIADKGTLVAAGGTLEVTSALEASSVVALVMEGGTITGSAEVVVTESLKVESGSTLSGTGTTVMGSGATATIANSGVKLTLSEHTLTNDGTFTVGKKNGIKGEKKAQLVNKGTLVVNGETAGENHGLIASEKEATLVNTGTVEKNEGTGITPMQFAIDNEGLVTVTSGKLEFNNGGVSGEHSTGSWSTSGPGTGVIFSANGSTFTLGANVPMTGSFEIQRGTVTAGVIEGSAANLTAGGYNSFQNGTLEITGSSASTFHSLTLAKKEEGSGGTLTGTAQVNITNTFTGEQGSLAGNGSTVIESGATGTIDGSKLGIFLSQRTLTNDGTLTVGSKSRIKGEKKAKLINNGILIINGEPASENHGLIASEKEATFVNSGTLKKTEGTGKSPIEFGFENLGAIIEEVGGFEIRYPILVESKTQLGGPENPSTVPDQQHVSCGDPVDCATGNLTETQTDFSIAGRGIGLNLTRTYNSQAAAEGAKGAFGYGWSSSFSDRLLLESKKITLTEADGSSVPFVEETGGSFATPTWSQDTLSGSAEAGYTLTFADQVKYKFSGSSGRLESATDRDGNTTTLSYTESGRLEKITDPAGRTLTFAYNGEGLVESVKDPMGHTVKYVYESGNLKSVTQPAESSLRWQFKYNGSHEMAEMLDGRGGKTVNEYNASKQLTSQKDPAERKLKFEYEPFQTKITNESTGSVSDERFTSNDEPYSITHGYGTASATTETFTYNAAGQVLTATDGDSHTTEYGYDSAGDRTSMIDPDKDETKWTYNATHDVETTTTPDGETTTIKREAHGNPEVIERAAPGGETQKTKYKYAAHGELESVTNPVGNTWTYEYDSYGDKTGETDPEGNKRTWEYNEDSQKTATVSPRGNAAGAEASKFTTKIERDAQGRPLKITDPLGHTTKYTYDGNGNAETVTDGNSHTTTYTYNADNQPVKVKEPNGTVSETEYDGAGQVIAQTDGNKHTTKYKRNILEQVTETTNPQGHKTTEEYDAAGNLTSLTDPAKRTTSYTYDAANRLTEVSYSSGKPAAGKYEYNKDGERTKITDATGTRTYVYDQLDRLSESKDGHGDTVKYEYSLANEPTKITYPTGKSVTRAYDKDGRLEQITDWLSDATRFAYDPDSNLASTTFPTATGDIDEYAYNDADQMSEVKMTKGTETLAALAYTRDNDSQLKTTTSEGLPGAASIEATYDENNRLSKYGTTEYKYDAANNLTTAGASENTYNEADELEKSAGAGYSYDELGERTKTTPETGPATTYGYDQAGDLTTVERPAEGSTPEIKDSYEYNSEALRTAQTVSGTTSYLTWDMAEELPLILSDEVNSYIYGPDGLPIEQINNSTGTIEYLHHDQAGSTRLLTGSTGKTEATFTYGPYGELTGSTGAATTPLGYDGRYTNSDTGLVYLRNRVYDPKTAQFLTVDPLKAITREPYSYAGDNPLTYADPTGLIFGIPGTPSWEEAGEAVAGWGDTITFGATKWVREQIGDENVDTCSGAYQTGGVAGLATGVFIPGEDDAEAGEAAEWAWKTRADEGADGGISEYGKERLEGETISTAHRVELEDEVIHQHQTHIGKYGGERQFPNEWIQYPDVEAP